MRRTLWFDRCLDWMFEAYTHATSRAEVRDYLSRHADLDDVLVRMIVQIRTRIAHEITIDAKVVNFGKVGEYLEVTVRQRPAGPGFVAGVQEIWDGHLADLEDKDGWIALIAEDRPSAEPAARARPKIKVKPAPATGAVPAWAGAN